MRRAIVIFSIPGHLDVHLDEWRRRTKDFDTRMNGAASIVTLDGTKAGIRLLLTLHLELKAEELRLGDLIELMQLFDEVGGSMISFTMDPLPGDSEPPN